MATSGNIKLLERTYYITGDTTKYSEHYLFTWTRVSYSAESNISVINWELKFIPYLYGSAINFNQYITLTVETTNYSGVLEWAEYNSAHTIMTGTSNIYHDLHGNKSFPISIIEKSSTTSAQRSASATIELDKIDREVSLLSAPDFTDEDNPVITYSNPAGASVQLLQACISFDGSSANVPYRDLNKSGSSYTFNLTEAERVALRAKLADGDTTTVRFYIKYSLGDVTTFTYLTATLTYINYEPIISPTITNDARTYELTGNRNTFIKYYSDATYNIGASGRKGATIDTSSLYINNGGNIRRGAQTGTLENISSNTFYMGATDTRGDEIKDFKVINLIQYVKLTSSLKVGALDANGEVTFTIEGKYYNGSFGAKDNTMEVEYAIRDEYGNYIFNSNGSGWVVLGEVAPDVDNNNNYTFSYTISGLDHNKQYELSVNVIDELTPLQTVTTVIQAIPVFDWSKEDFKHYTNVEIAAGKKLTIGGRDYGEARVLWDWEDGATSHLIMDGSAIVNLKEPISAQPNGIVLVFSLYRNSTVEDVSINTFFVSKQEVALLSGAPHTFIMGINSGFSTIGAKYLYITDTKVTGNATNGSSGNNSGISFNNGMFVLRYIIGV